MKPSPTMTITKLPDGSYVLDIHGMTYEDMGNLTLHFIEQMAEAEGLTSVELSKKVTELIIARSKLS